MISFPIKDSLIRRAFHTCPLFTCYLPEKSSLLKVVGMRSLAKNGEIYYGWKDAMTKREGYERFLAYVGFSVGEMGVLKGLSRELRSQVRAWIGKTSGVRPYVR